MCKTNKNESFIYREDRSLSVFSKPICFANDKIHTNNASYENISWVDSTIILSESITFNSSSNLLIRNCTIIFSPLNASSHVKVILGESSRLNISNSILFVDNNVGGGGSIEFYGDELFISNSSIIGLGQDDYHPGFFIRSSQISISDSNFLSGFNGIVFYHSQDIEIIDCSFQDFTGVEGYGGIGIYGYNSVRINLSGCTFNNTQVGISLHNCRYISVDKSIFILSGFAGLYLYPNSFYYEVNDVWIENNTFIDSNFGIIVIGRDITILKNFFINLSYTGMNIAGRNINISFNTFQRLRRGITTLESLGSLGEILISSISNVIIQGNIFDKITITGVLIQNYDFPTIFYITENNFTSNGVGLAFRGNLGGFNSSERSWVTGNLFNNITEFAIQGYSFDFLAHFQFTSFVGNAFINSSYPYTSFQVKYYYMDDIRWDNGFIGNYWELHLDDSECRDEDNNQIGDLFYVISGDHGQFDKAPLLSLSFFRSYFKLCSTHPSDLVRSRSEVKGENGTLSWSVQAEDRSNIVVLLDGTYIKAIQNGSEITVSLRSLAVGLYNFSLVIQNGNQLYKDLVWVQILKNESNLVTDVFIPFGTLLFLIAIGLVIIIHIKKRKSSKIFR